MAKVLSEHPSAWASLLLRQAFTDPLGGPDDAFHKHICFPLFIVYPPHLIAT